MTGSGSLVAAPSFTVELVGIPGSGKSRLARMLAAELAGRGVSVEQPQRRYESTVPAARRLTRKAIACVAAGGTAPVHTTRLVQRLARSGQEGPGDVAGRLVQLVVARDVAGRAARRTGVSIVDEGLVQALWSVGLHGDVSAVLPVLEHGLREPLADLLVVLQVPEDLALARLSSRSSQHSRIQQLPEAARLAELKQGNRLLCDLVAWWSSRPGHPRETCVLTQPEEGSDERELLLDRICGAAGVH